MHVFSLEVWPGFVTSILQFENHTMLVADVSHKILHGHTVLDTMYDAFEKNRGSLDSFKDIIAKKMIGQIILTRQVQMCFISIVQLNIPVHCNDKMK